MNRFNESVEINARGGERNRSFRTCNEETDTSHSRRVYPRWIACSIVGRWKVIFNVDFLREERERERETPSRRHRSPQNATDLANRRLWFTAKLISETSPPLLAPASVSSPSSHLSFPRFTYIRAVRTMSRFRVFQAYFFECELNKVVINLERREGMIDSCLLCVDEWIRRIFDSARYLWRGKGMDRVTLARVCRRYATENATLACACWPSGRVIAFTWGRREKRRLHCLSFTHNYRRIIIKREEKIADGFAHFLRSTVRIIMHERG